MKNEVSQSSSTEISLLMNRRLAAVIDLQEQFKQSDWNIEYPDFIELHELSGRVSEAVEAYTDAIAKRLVQLGCIAEGTLRGAPERRQTIPIRRSNHSEILNRKKSP